MYIYIYIEREREHTHGAQLLSSTCDPRCVGWLIFGIRRCHAVAGLVSHGMPVQIKQTHNTCLWLRVLLFVR